MNGKEIQELIKKIVCFNGKSLKSFMLMNLHSLAGLEAHYPKSVKKQF